MAHKNSRGDKDSKGCEIGADTPHARRKKGFYKYVITDEFGATRFAYEGLWLWAAD